MGDGEDEKKRREEEEQEEKKKKTEKMAGLSTEKEEKTRRRERPTKLGRASWLTPRPRQRRPTRRFGSRFLVLSSFLTIERCWPQMYTDRFTSETQGERKEKKKGRRRREAVHGFSSRTSTGTPDWRTRERQKGIAERRRRKRHCEADGQVGRLTEKCR